MIVDPDFLDHWRTMMVIDALGKDNMAPIYILRIWAHCQSRKSTTFDGMPSEGLKALCRFPGNAQLLENTLIEAGFIERDGCAIKIPKWAKHNAKLLSNWQNGSTGGRPRRDCDDAQENNPNETQTKPNCNPTVTQTEPNGNPNYPLANPTLTDKIREDKRREDKDIELVPNDVGDDCYKSTKQDCPHKAIIKIYHDILPMCPSIRDWTAARSALLKARWNEDSERQDLEWWTRFFEYIKTCNFLIGKAGKNPFIVDLPWILKAENFAKIREGRYENR